MILREIKELINYHRKYTIRFAEHDCRNVFKKAKMDLKSFGFDGFKGKKILDLGCGQRFSFSLQCAEEEGNVVALDLDYVKPDVMPLYFLQTAKYNGLKRAFKSILRRIFFDDKYYRTLEKTYGNPLLNNKNKIEFVVADPKNVKYLLPSESFDLIFTNAVIEHVKNISLFASEILRLLRIGGYFYGIIHNFYSLSGGHNLEWAFPDEQPSQRVPPWDHLRQNYYPSWAPLNKLKPEKYENAFSKHMDILLFEGKDINHDLGKFEGEKFLTPDIEEELHKYPRDLLLIRSFCIICKKNKI